MYRLNTLLTAVLLVGPAMAQTLSPSMRDTKISAEQVSFYEVPLACPAARGLGCGSAAKPMLVALEKKKTIEQASLDHSGTTLAIVWKNGSKADARAAEIQSVADDPAIALHEVTGERRGWSMERVAPPDR